MSFPSPFEIFRSPIQIRRFTQGFYLNGIWQEGSQVTLSSVLVTGNVINITFNGVILSPITFSVSASVTMALIAAAILAQPNVQQVDISTNNLILTIVPLQPNLSFINSFTITAGASQPTPTIINSPIIIAATASLQPIGEDLQLVPEGRRDRNNFAFFSSTQIFDLTTQNPDQVVFLTPPLNGQVFEVIEVHTWQNNANFAITNHYKFIALKLHPLPGVLG